MDQMEHVYDQMSTTTSQCDFTTVVKSSAFILLTVE